MKPKKWFIVIIDILVIALFLFAALLYSIGAGWLLTAKVGWFVVTSGENGRIAFYYLAKEIDGRTLGNEIGIKKKHSLAKFSKIKKGMSPVEVLELLGEQTTSEGSYIPTLVYKIDKGWVVKVAPFAGSVRIVDYPNSRGFELEDDGYSAPSSYLNAAAKTDGRDNRPKHSLAKFSKIKIGMNPAEVVKLAGKPTDSVDSSFIWYRYKIDKGWYMDLHFFNEQLSDMSIVDYPNNRVFELEQEDYITTLPCPNTVAQTGDSGSTGTFTDDRDGKTYRTVKIGRLTWMAENLNFVTDSSVCFENADSNCTRYGRLYYRDTAMAACPAGWRLPSDEDWLNLALAVAGKCNGRVHWNIAGTKLKSTTGWNGRNYSGSSNGTDDFGFSALPGGWRYGGSWGKASFSVYSDDGGWWASGDGVTSARVWYISKLLGRHSEIMDHLSVRCVRE